MTFRILLICSGNVCRSPYAELLLAQHMAARPDFEVISAGTIARPGMHMTDKMVGVAVAHGVPEQRALDHEASRLLEDTVESADLILGLTRDHRAAAVQLAPSALRRTFTLTEFARLSDAIAPADSAPSAGRLGEAEWRPASDSAGRLGEAEWRPITPEDLVSEAFTTRTTTPSRTPSVDDIDDPIGRSQETYARVGAEITAAIQSITRALLSTVPGTPRKLDTPTTTGGPSLDFSFRPA